MSAVAYFPNAKLKHTNEVLVHLGEGFYVQRTAHECGQIIDRRLEKVYENESRVDSEIQKHKDSVGVQA